MADLQLPLVPRPQPKLLSIVVPLFNEEQVVPLLRASLTKFLEELPIAAEVLLVNDGSTDGTQSLLHDWAEADSRVRVLALARNFGHQAAATAGLDHAAGDAVVLIDADLQDPLDVMHDMLREYCRGYDVVYARRRKRAGESWFKRATAFLFYRLMQYFVLPDLPADTGDFRLISRACLDALLKLRETHRFLRGMVTWVGFPQTAVVYDRQPRVAGSTHYSFAKMFRFAANAAISFSARPLRISFGFALVAVAGGVAVGAYAFFRALLGFYVVHGWASLMVVTCLIGTAILISIGILGEYVGRVFEEVKRRPLYVVARQTHFAAHQGQADSPEVDHE